MRGLFLAILIPLAGCSSLPTVPAPWEPSESQMSEPTQPADAASPAWTRIGSSIRGKPIEAVTLGNGPHRIYIIGGIRGDEPEGPAVASRLPASLVADFISEAGEKSTVRIVRDMNPDGTASRTRANTRGIDLNRNWPSRDYRPEATPGSNSGRRAASELEITTVQADLAAFKPDLVVVFGTAATGRGPEVSFLARSPVAAYDFSAGARKIDAKWRVVPGQRTVGPGSIESFVGRDMGKSILAVEFRRGSDTAENLKAARAGILALATSGPSKPAAKTDKPPQPEAPIKDPVLGGR